MHMQPAQKIALADHLQVVHDRVIAVFLGLLGLSPSRGRMRAGRENGETIFGSNRGDGLPQVPQLGARIGCVDVRRRNHLDLRLQKLPRSPALGRGFDGFEEFL